MWSVDDGVGMLNKRCGENKLWGWIRKEEDGEYSWLYVVYICFLKIVWNFLNGVICVRGVSFESLIWG